MDVSFNTPAQPLMVSRGAQDLNERRETITKLYWDEDKKLPEVMSIMENQYRFKATQKQYKGAFKRWDLNKNVNNTDMRHMVRIRKRRREEEDKATRFESNKRPVLEEKIDRFVQRTGPNVIVSIYGLPETGPTPPNIMYDTPSEYHSLPPTPSSTTGQQYRTPSELEFHTPQETQGLYSSQVTPSASPLAFSDDSPAAFYSMPTSPLREEINQIDKMQDIEASYDSVEPYSHRDQDETGSLEDSDADTVVEVSREDVYPDEQAKDDSVELSSQKDFETAGLSAAMRSLSVAIDDNAIGKILRSACRRGDRHTVSKILSSGFKDIDNESPGQWTALHCAAFEGHSEIVADLIEAGANGYSPYGLYHPKKLIKTAVRMNKRECLSILIRLSSEPHGTRKAIGMFAVQKYDLECLKWIIQRSELGDLNQPFEMAVDNQYIGAVRLLLTQDAIESDGKYGAFKSFARSQVILSDSDTWNMTRVLIKNGCFEAMLEDIELWLNDADINKFIRRKVFKNHECTLILRGKVAENPSCKKAATSKLMAALRRQDLDAAMFLLYCGVEVNESDYWKDDLAALLLAVIEFGDGYYDGMCYDDEDYDDCEYIEDKYREDVDAEHELVRLLLSCGANPFSTPHEHALSPMLKAEQLEKREIQRLFRIHYVYHGMSTE